MVTEHRVREVLRAVLDPHMNIDVVQMGMIRSIDVGPGGDVAVGLAFPCIGCPAWTMIQEDIREAVAAVEGVNRVDVRVQWTKAWCKDDLAPEARQRIRTFGYQILPME